MKTRKLLVKEEEKKELSPEIFCDHVVDSGSDVCKKCGKVLQ